MASESARISYHGISRQVIHPRADDTVTVRAPRLTATHRPDSKDEEDWYVSERAIPRGHWMRADDTESGALVWEAS